MVFFRPFGSAAQGAPSDEADETGQASAAVVDHTDIMVSKAHHQRPYERHATTIWKALHQFLGQGVEITTSGKGTGRTVRGQ